MLPVLFSHSVSKLKAISKAVDELVLEDSLIEKVYGKQKVFVVSQVRSVVVNHDSNVTSVVTIPFF